MLALHPSLFNGEYTLINALKALDWIMSDHVYVQSPCNFFVEDYIKIFYTTYKWNVSSIRCKMVLRLLTTAREVDSLNLVLLSPLSWDRAGVF
jgi:hypothetical protein